MRIKQEGSYPPDKKKQTKKTFIFLIAFIIVLVLWTFINIPILSNCRFDERIPLIHSCHWIFHFEEKL